MARRTARATHDGGSASCERVSLHLRFAKRWLRPLKILCNSCVLVQEERENLRYSSGTCRPTSLSVNRQGATSWEDQRLVGTLLIED